MATSPKENPVAINHLFWAIRRQDLSTHNLFCRVCVRVLPCCTPCCHAPRIHHRNGISKPASPETVLVPRGQTPQYGGGSKASSCFIVAKWKLISDASGLKDVIPQRSSGPKPNKALVNRFTEIGARWRPLRASSYKTADGVSSPHRLTMQSKVCYTMVRPFSIPFVLCG